jgi:hypothetical protein
MTSKLIPFPARPKTQIEKDRRARPYAAACANAAAAKMARKLKTATPADLGWPELTPKQLIASEWCSSFHGDEGPFFEDDGAA